MNVLPEEAPRPRQPSDFPPGGPNSLAGFWARGAARTIDVVIVFIPFVLLLLPFATYKNNKPTTLPAWTALAFIALFGTYEVALEAWTGQTLGKMALGVRVAQLVNGRRPDPGQVALRTLVPLTVLALPILVFAWPLIYMSAMFNPLLRGIHDHAGGTVVVRTR